MINPFFRKLDSIGDYLSYPLIRFITGILLIPHGYGKIYRGFNGDLDGFINFLDKEYSNPLFTGFFLAYLIALTEFVGGICIALGFFTRIAALAVTIFMAFAVEQHLNQGFFWTKEGYEYPLMWGVLTFAIFLKGSGGFSIDRKFR
tara:strand:- start:48 stop:485 length:438 start_codon:yes stop_codon:yes gene_type:complete